EVYDDECFFNVGQSIKVEFTQQPRVVDARVHVGYGKLPHPPVGLSTEAYGVSYLIGSRSEQRQVLWMDNCAVEVCVDSHPVDKVAEIALAVIGKPYGVRYETLAGLKIKPVEFHGIL